MRSTKTRSSRKAATALCSILMLLACVISATLSGCIDPNNPPRDYSGKWTQANNLKVPPQWTPDGKLIVFEHRETIYTVNTEGTKLRRITSGKDQDYKRHEAPAISPDGTRIAYSTTRHKVRRSDGRIRNFDIEVMELNGSNRKRLSTSPEWDLNPTWSDDGTKVIFSRETQYEGVPSGTFVVNDDGTEEQQVTWIAHHLRPEARHNGRYALALSERELEYAKTGVWPIEEEIKRETIVLEKGETFLATADLNLGNLVEHKRFPDFSFPNPENPSFQRIAMEQISGGPTWSPDGRQLAYVLKRYQPEVAQQLIQHRKSEGPEPEGKFTLDVLNLTDSKETSIELPEADCGTGFGAVASLKWSPDGRHILINSSTLPCVADLETGKLRVAGPTPTANWQNPDRAWGSWSPTGEKIAIQNECGPTRCWKPAGEDNVLIFTVRHDGTEFKPLVRLDREGPKAAQK